MSHTAPPTRVRPFQRADREQLTALVNAHIAAVIPGGSVSVQGLLSWLESEPSEYIVNPWIDQRVTLVAEQHDRLVAAALLIRYGAGAHVGAALRNVGEIRFLVFWPPSPLFPDTVDAAQSLLTAATTQFDSWEVSTVLADGTLPAPGVYGVPEQWPHIHQLYAEFGFGDPRRTEMVLFARVANLQRPTAADLNPVRSLGVTGTRITAIADGTALGYIEVDTNLDTGARTSRFGEWADIGNLFITVPQRRPELTSWLLGRAAEWLELAGATNLLSYADKEFPAEANLLQSNGFQLLTTVGRGYQRTVSQGMRPAAGAPRR